MGRCRNLALECARLLSLCTYLLPKIPTANEDRRERKRGENSEDTWASPILNTLLSQLKTGHCLDIALKPRRLNQSLKVAFQHSCQQSGVGLFLLVGDIFVKVNEMRPIIGNPFHHQPPLLLQSKHRHSSKRVDATQLEPLKWTATKKLSILMTSHFISPTNQPCLSPPEEM